MNAPLTIEGIRRRLVADTVGRHLYLFGEVESTNATLRALARQGAVEGTTVIAEAQRAGRARLGRPWFSPPGVNLHASVLLRPGGRPADAARLGFVAGLAVSDAIRGLGLYPALKWPNDVLLDGRKVAGGLIDCLVAAERVEALIVGVGVNLNVRDAALAEALGPEAALATSVSAVLGRPVDRNDFAAAYLSHLDTWLRRYRERGIAPVLDAWRERDVLTGRHVVASLGEEEFDGLVQGLDGDGRLVLRSPSGVRRTLTNEAIRTLD